MTSLKNKIDFCGVIIVNGANPNGDPILSNQPRQEYDGYGFISDVAIKRKIRNRLQDMGESIFYQAEDRIDDGYKSLAERIRAYKPYIDEMKISPAPSDKLKRIVCDRWTDVRCFGAVLAFKGAGKSGGTSMGIRGPVTVTHAHSLDVLEIERYSTTRSMNSEEGSAKKDASTFNNYNTYVKHATYVFYGSITTQLAEKTGMTEEDAEKIHKALISLFENDASSMRPVGTMHMDRVYWWKHNSAIGQYPSLKVYQTLSFKPADIFPYYTVEENPLPKLHCDKYIF